ncbi:MAG: AI-2E family transporter [Clostridia bacterium]
MKKFFWAATVIIIVFFLFNLQAGLDLLKSIGNTIYPVFIGVVVALMLNAPVKLLEKSILSSPKVRKVKRLLSISITLAVIGGLIGLIYLIVSPEVVRSLDTLRQKLPDFSAESIKALMGDTPFFAGIAENLGRLLDGAAEYLADLLPAVADFLSDAVRTVINIFLGVVFGILIIFNKEQLVAEFTKVLKYFLGEIKARKTVAAFSLAADKFSRFLGGQALEAVLFGGICYLVFSAFRIPYAALAALIMGMGNLIPMLGGYIAGVLAFIFIFTASAEKAIIFVVIILILQQLEQITTYPIVVGRYVGISSFWVLFAVIVGGGLFGFWGLILGVPVVAFIDNFFKVMFNKKFKAAEEQCTPSEPIT